MSDDPRAPLSAEERSEVRALIRKYGWYTIERALYDEAYDLRDTNPDRPNNAPA